MTAIPKLVAVPSVATPGCLGSLIGFFILPVSICPLPKAMIRHCLAPCSVGKDAVLAGQASFWGRPWSVPWVQRGSWHAHGQQQGGQAWPLLPAARDWQGRAAAWSELPSRAPWATLTGHSEGRGPARPGLSIGQQVTRVGSRPGPSTTQVPPHLGLLRPALRRGPELPQCPALGVVFWP